MIPNNSWKPFFELKVNKELLDGIMNELKEHRFIPSKENLFKAFNYTAKEEIKVVLLGQDPYHTKGLATGLSFGVPKGAKIPPSLRNIFKELGNDLGYETPPSGDLTPWARQGVFLLNAILSCEEKKPLAHAKIGWETFTDNVLREIASFDRPVAFLLFGAYAQKKEFIIKERQKVPHLIFKAPHPSGFSAHRGFFHSSPFSKVNAFLESHHIKPINWNLYF